ELGNKNSVALNLGNIGIIYGSQSEYSKALEYFHKSLKINEELQNKEGIAGNLGNLGAIYNYQSDIPKALEYYHKAFRINEEIGNKKGVAANLLNIGNIYKYKSDYIRALENYQQALKINEELGNKKGVANSLGYIGLLYSSQANYPKALEYYLKTLKIEEELGNKSGIAGTLNNIGGVYNYQFEYEKALEYFQKALKINEETNNKRWIAYNLGNIGSIYSSLFKYSEALDYFQKALKMNIEIGNIYGKANNFSNMGDLYLKLSKESVVSKIMEREISINLDKEINLNKSIDFFLEAIKIFEEIGEKEAKTQTYKGLADAYFDRGDYKRAFEAFKEYKTLQDSVFNMDKAKEIANLEAKRENELKDKEIVILQTEKKAQQFQSYLLGGGVIVLFGAFGLAFIRFREKKKLSDKLAIQKSEIETQKSIVEEKNEQITASITYASTIQSAILPWDSTLKKVFGEILVFYKPKDIVSGDSYWFKEVEGIKFLAVIDCTGHGIPGAMLTVIASSVLDDAVLGKRLNDTGRILTFMNEKVTEVLNQRLEENKIRDGMEVCMLAIHQNKVQFSGAGRPLYLKNGTLEIFKTDKRGIAGQTENDEYTFSSVEIDRTENMMLYLTSDGYSDQMNEKSKKFSTKRFVALLDSISDKPISDQYEILENEFNSHKGGRSQIDDVTIIGVKL
ncbi:MAG: tetratricopeptide repeat protein, partial [Candidatus Kapabacteria bacterium]|nr:tetratricopeptide repeat protein [Candidatus Kapabacteria bacterium]